MFETVLSVECIPHHMQRIAKTKIVEKKCQNTVKKKEKNFKEEDAW